MRDNHKEIEKEGLIRVLTDWLPALRASIGISQAEIARYVGISRQTYCIFELKKRKMGWSTFLTLFLFFISNARTYEIMKMKKGYVAQVYKALQYEPESGSVQYSAGFENIFDNEKE